MKIRSMRGTPIDMSLLMAQNSHKIALGNAGMNARGDKVDKNGKVIKPREEIAREYHRANPKAVKQVALRDIKQEVMASPTPAQVVAKQRDIVQAQQAQQKELKKSQRKIIDSQ